MTPLNNWLLIFTFLFTNVKIHSWKASDMVTFFVFNLWVISWDEFPKLILFLASFCSNYARTLSWLTIERRKNHIVFSAKDCIFSSSYWSDSKFLIGSIIPLEYNCIIELLRVLRDIKYHIISHSRDESIKTIFRKAHMKDINLFMTMGLIN